MVSESKMYLPHSFKAATTASSIKGLLKQVGTGSGGCTSTTRDPGNPKANRVCTIEKASRVFPYTSALPRIKHDTPSVILQTKQLTVPSQFLRYWSCLVWPISISFTNHPLDRRQVTHNMGLSYENCPHEIICFILSKFWLVELETAKFVSFIFWGRYIGFKEISKHTYIPFNVKHRTYAHHLPWPSRKDPRM